MKGLYKCSDYRVLIYRARARARTHTHTYLFMSTFCVLQCFQFSWNPPFWTIIFWSEIY